MKDYDQQFININKFIIVALLLTNMLYIVSLFMAKTCNMLMYNSIHSSLLGNTHYNVSWNNCVVDGCITLFDFLNWANFTLKLVVSSNFPRFFGPPCLIDGLAKHVYAMRNIVFEHYVHLVQCWNHYEPLQVDYLEPHMQLTNIWRLKHDEFWHERLVESIRSIPYLAHPWIIHLKSRKPNGNSFSSSHTSILDVFLSLMKEIVLVILIMTKHIRETTWYMALYFLPRTWWFAIAHQPRFWCVLGCL